MSTDITKPTAHIYWLWLAIFALAGACISGYLSLRGRDDCLAEKISSNELRLQVQLGLGHVNGANLPTKVGELTGWSHISCAAWHTIAVNASSGTYVWGNNNDGQLGLGIFDCLDVPTLLTDSTDWVMIAGDAYHTAGIRY